MTPATCPTCGDAISAEAIGGGCPRCLLEAGFATVGAPPAAADHVPTPEELAPKFPGLVIEDLLGRGGMGVVYRARHKALDRAVALKVLSERVGGDRAFAERFQREARALAKLQHPNIVGVHDFGQTDGLFWLVMEFVDGTNIRQAMKAGQIGPKESLAIVPQICDALQYAHEHGVVHRDIKPENVMLDRSGRVKVADFGLAKLMEPGAADAALTGVGQVMGTVHYMAPEQWERPKEVDHRADIYSLGVVFYEMLTGELPLGRFDPPSSRVQVDVRLDEVVLRSLQKAPERRYQHVSEVKTDVGVIARGPAVAAAVESEAAAAPATESAPPTHTLHGDLGEVDMARKERRAAWLLLLGGIVGWLLWDRQPFVLTVPLTGLALLLLTWWRNRRRGGSPAKADAGSAIRVLVAVAICSVVPLVVMAFTLTTQRMRDASGTLAAVVAVLFFVEIARLRARRSASGAPDTWSKSWLVEPVAEKACGGRLSKLAVAGALGVPLAVTTVMALSALGQFGDRALFVGALVVLIGWMASVAAWVRIQRSGGRLRGRAWAAFGSILPVLAFCVVAPVVYFLVRPGVRLEVDGPAGNVVRVPASSRDFSALWTDGTPAGISAEERERIASLWESTLALGPNPSLDAAQGLYAMRQRDSLASQGKRAAEGNLGLPLTPETRLPGPLKDFRLVTVLFEQSMRPMGAVGIAADEKHLVAFELSRDYVMPANSDGALGPWCFDPGPVVWRPVPTDGDVVPLVRTQLAYASVLSLLDSLPNTSQPRTLDGLNIRYTQDAVKRIFDLPEAERLPRGAKGELGLPLASDETLGARISDFEIEGFEAELKGVLSPGRRGTAVLVVPRTGRRIAATFAYDADGWWRATADPIEVR